MAGNIEVNKSEKEVTFIGHTSIIFSSLVVSYVIALFVDPVGLSLTIFFIPLFAILGLFLSLVLSGIFYWRNIPWRSDLLTGYLLIAVLNIWNVADPPKPDGITIPWDYKPALLKFYLGNADGYEKHLHFSAELGLLYLITGFGCIFIRRKLNPWLVVVPGIVLLMYEIL